MSELFLNMQKEIARLKAVARLKKENRTLNNKLKSVVAGENLHAGQLVKIENGKAYKATRCIVCYNHECTCRFQ